MGGGPGQEAFRRLMRDHVGPSLREAGFVGSGTAYRLPLPDAFAIVGFQRSIHATSDRVTFTVNLTAGPIARWDAARRTYPYLPEAPAANTRYPGGLWHARVGLQMPAAQDRWWEVDARTDLAELADEVVRASATTRFPRSCNTPAGRPKHAPDVPEASGGGSPGRC